MAGYISTRATIRPEICAIWSTYEEVMAVSLQKCHWGPRAIQAQAAQCLMIV